MSNLNLIVSPTIVSRIIDVLRQHISSVPQNVDMNAKLAHYGLNSMKSVEVMFGLEDEFKITIDETELDDNSFNTVLSIATLVSEKVSLDG